MIKPLPIPGDLVKTPEPMLTIKPGMFDPVVIDVYRLPPYHFLTPDCLESSLQMLDCCTSKRQRVHWAASIILGQPFA